MRGGGGGGGRQRDEGASLLKEGAAAPLKSPMANRNKAFSLSRTHHHHNRPL